MRGWGDVMHSGTADCSSIGKAGIVASGAVAHTYARVTRPCDSSYAYSFIACLLAGTLQSLVTGAKTSVPPYCFCTQRLRGSTKVRRLPPAVSGGSAGPCLRTTSAERSAPTDFFPCHPQWVVPLRGGGLVRTTGFRTGGYVHLDEPQVLSASAIHGGVGTITSFLMSSGLGAIHLGG